MRGTGVFGTEQRTLVLQSRTLAYTGPVRCARWRSVRFHEWVSGRVSVAVEQGVVCEAGANESGDSLRTPFARWRGARESRGAGRARRGLELSRDGRERPDARRVREGVLGREAASGVSTPRCGSAMHFARARVQARPRSGRAWRRVRRGAGASLRAGRHGPAGTRSGRVTNARTSAAALANALSRRLWACSPRGASSAPHDVPSPRRAQVGWPPCSQMCAATRRVRSARPWSLPVPAASAPTEPSEAIEPAMRPRAASRDCISPCLPSETIPGARPTDEPSSTIRARSNWYPHARS